MAVPISMLHGSTGKRLGRRAGQRRRDARAHGAGDQRATPEQRAAIDQTVASNLRRRIAATIPPLAHDVLLADRHIRSRRFQNGAGPRPLPYLLEFLAFEFRQCRMQGCAFCVRDATARTQRRPRRANAKPLSGRIIFQGWRGSHSASIRWQYAAGSLACLRYTPRPGALSAPRSPASR